MLQGVHRLCQERDDAEEVDQGIERGCEEDEEDEEEKPREKEGKERDGLSGKAQKKEHSLPERRSRRLKSEVSSRGDLFHRTRDDVEVWCPYLHCCNLLFCLASLLEIMWI